MSEYKYISNRPFSQMELLYFQKIVVHLQKIMDMAVDEKDSKEVSRWIEQMENR